MKAPNLKNSIFPSAVALGLLLAVANANALTNSTPARAVAPAAKTARAQSTLTPTVTKSAPAPPAGEDIRDIRQPRHAHTPWFWVVVAAGVALLLAAIFAVWHWLRHSKAFEMTAAEIALQHLNEARQLMDPEHAREYCFAVSKIIRGYLEEQWQLHAPRLTTEEFLRELVEGNERIAAPHRELLGDFLLHCDLAKFAGWRYSLPALAEMHDGAIDFVKKSSIPLTAAKSAIISTPSTLEPMPMTVTEPELVNKQ